jgi:hypothetical protein
MPESKKKRKPVQPISPTPPPAPLVSTGVAPTPTDGREKKYHEVAFTQWSTAVKRGPITPELCKKLMGLETEREYLARMLEEHPGTTAEQWMINPKKRDVFGDSYHCINAYGEKVRANYNANNRAYDPEWAGKMIHMILHGQWAGPFTYPGATINGEAIRISEYGNVVSGQHEMTACYQADQVLQIARKDKLDTPENPLYPVWKGHDHVFIEACIATGITEHVEVLRTIDYVKPRTMADVLYTSGTFKDAPENERRELCRNFAQAGDLLWTRTDTRGYRTHPEMVAFLDRHPRLMQCVLHLFEENRPAAGRRINLLHLATGQCAALMYIMATSGPGTEGDIYRNESPPSEKNLDFTYWDKAEEFWTLLTSGTDFDQVRDALISLTDSTPLHQTNQGLGGRQPEKFAILKKAWELWKDHPVSAGPPFNDEDLAPGGLLRLNYTNLGPPEITNNETRGGVPLPYGEIRLLDDDDFGGIDAPPAIKRRTNLAPPEQEIVFTNEEMEQAKQAAKTRRAN